MLQLKVGAGKARIVFPDGYFPHEGYYGEYSPMYVRALVMEQEERLVLLSVELPSIRPFELTDALRRQVAEHIATPTNCVWLCMTHSLGAPHTPSVGDGQRHEMHMTAVKNAIMAAVDEAMAKIQSAKISYAQKEVEINVDREIESVDGWWMGLKGENPVDNTLHMIRFDDVQGQPIAILYNHPMKSCVLEATDMSDGKRYASSDLCGAVSAIAEEHYGVPALFFMGAGGDTFPKKKGNYMFTGAEGHFETVNCEETAYEYLRELSCEVWQGLRECIENCVACDSQETAYKHTSVVVPGQKPYPRDRLGQPPIKHYVFEEDESQVINYSLLQIGDCVVVAVKSEVSYPTMTKLRACSPFKNTMLFSMVNGGQGYIPEEQQFNRLVHPAVTSTLARGCADIFSRSAIAEIHKFYLR